MYALIKRLVGAAFQKGCDVQARKLPFGCQASLFVAFATLRRKKDRAGQFPADARNESFFTLCPGHCGVGLAVGWSR